MAVPSNWSAWKAALLAALGAPDTPANDQFLNAWAQAEGGSASNNPFNTTQTEPGSSMYNNLGNGQGVQNYPDAQTGLVGTVRTLTNGYYNGIIAALRQGTSAQNTATAVAQSPWGTGAGVLRVLGSGPGQVPLNVPGAPADTTANPKTPQGGLGSAIVGFLEMAAGGVVLLVGVVLMARLVAGKVGLSIDSATLAAIPGVGEAQGVVKGVRQGVRTKGETRRRSGYERTGAGEDAARERAAREGASAENRATAQRQLRTIAAARRGTPHRSSRPSSAAKYAGTGQAASREEAGF